MLQLIWLMMLYLNWPTWLLLLQLLQLTWLMMLILHLQDALHSHQHTAAELLEVLQPASAYHVGGSLRLPLPCTQRPLGSRVPRAPARTLRVRCGDRGRGGAGGGGGGPTLPPPRRAHEAGGATLLGRFPHPSYARVGSFLGLVFHISGVLGL